MAKETVKADTKAKKADKKSTANKKSGKPGIFSRIGRYFKDLRSESKKIVWPTRSQAVNNTLIVIAMILIVGVVIWGLDALFGFAVSTLLQR